MPWPVPGGAGDNLVDVGDELDALAADEGHHDDHQDCHHSILLNCIYCITLPGWRGVKNLNKNTTFSAFLPRQKSNSLFPSAHSIFTSSYRLKIFLAMGGFFLKEKFIGQ